MLLDYNLKSTSVKLLAGVPLLVRETRPDGLTRSVVFGLEYSVHF